MRAPRPGTTAVAVLAAMAAAGTLAGCGGTKTGSSAQGPGGQTSAAPVTATTTSGPPVIPGVPDPCALLPASQILDILGVDSGAKTGPVEAPGGGRACAYNPGHPNTATISLTPVSKAGFDAFRALAKDTVTNLPGIGQEAYRSSQTPGVVDVFQNGFDLNVWVIHADSTSDSNTDAKKLAAALAPKVQ